MIYTRLKVRADANPESPPRIQHKINIREVPTPSKTVFTPEHYELLVQRVVQDYQGLEGEALYYHIIGLHESTTEDDFKKAYRKQALSSQPEKNNYPQASADFRMIQEAKKGLEDVLHHNDTMRRTKEREKYLQRQ